MAGIQSKKAKRILRILVESIVCLAIGALIVISFAMPDVGHQWDLLKQGECDSIPFAISTLILFRFLLYFSPAFLVWILLMLFFKKCTRGKRIALLIDCYNVQFFAFSIIAALYNLFGFDYLFNLDILSKMDAFVFILGLLVTLFIKKEIPIKEINKIDSIETSDE